MESFKLSVQITSETVKNEVYEVKICFFGRDLNTLNVCALKTEVIVFSFSNEFVICSFAGPTASIFE